MREMKDSGIEWVGKVPKIWSLKPIRALFDEVTEKNFLGTCSNALKFTYGSIVRKPNFDADADDYVASTILNYTVVEPGTIMLNGLNLNFDFVSQRIGLVKEKGVITSAYMAFKPNEKHLIDSEFATYLFKAYDGCKAFHNMGGGVRKILNFNEFKKYYIPLPDLNEQHHIVDYLDTQCSEIDATAEDIQKEISLLEDYKKSVITEAVTKGLNPDAEMKDSGIEWIGEIPKHWKVIRFKYIAIVKSNLVAPIRYMNYPQIAPDVIEKNTGKIISHRSVEEANVDSWNHLFYKGQILYSKIRPVLNKVVIAPYDGLCSADMYPISAKENVRFLQYIMLSAFFVKQVDLVTRDRIKMPKINQDELGNILLVWTSKEEQQQIADFLDSKCSEIDSLIADKKRQLDILADYKKSLIYEYVTGKKEVPVKDF